MPPLINLRRAAPMSRGDISTGPSLLSVTSAGFTSSDSLTDDGLLDTFLD